MDAVAGELHVSEFVLYGVFVDHVLGGTSFGGPLCHNYYERTPLSPADAQAFAEQMPSNALGAMISSHSHTPQHVRREAFRRCAEITGGNSSKLAGDALAQLTGWAQCLGTAMPGRFDVADPAVRDHCP